MENQSIDVSGPLILTLAALKSPPAPSPLNVADVGLFGSLNPTTSTGNALADVWISMHESTHNGLLSRNTRFLSNFARNVSTFRFRAAFVPDAATGYRRQFY